MNTIATTAPTAAAPSHLRLIPSSFRIRDERRGDVAAREALLDAAFGPARFAKTCERLREGREAAVGLSFVATDDGAVVGTVRLWSVTIGGVSSLMLGPLAVSADKRSAGVGGALMEHALRRAKQLGHASIILVGDAPYYARWGFTANLTGDFMLPGPVDPARFLALELAPTALAGVAGDVVATGVRSSGEAGPRRAA